MDQIKTGKLIRALRTRENMTQLALAERLGVSDKAVSKWERGCGAPDISLLPLLAETLQVSAQALLRGELGENDRTNGDMKKVQIYRCPVCGNLQFSTGEAEVHCCGRKVERLAARESDAAHRLEVSLSDGEWLIAAAHEMRREHHISFVAFLNGDTLVVRKLYPEWDMVTRLPYFAHGLLLWYCTRDGLFYQSV